MNLHGNATRRVRIEGMLFDTAYLEPDIYLWVLTEQGKLVVVHTSFFPTFYIAGPRAMVERAADGAARAGFARPQGWTRRTEFWKGESIPVMILRALRPSRVINGVRRLLQGDPRLRAYDVAIDPCLAFHSRYRLFPLARVALCSEGDRLIAVKALDEPLNPDWRLPTLRTLTLRLAQSPLVTMEQGNTVLATTPVGCCRITADNVRQGLCDLNDLLYRHDPDVIDSVRGDQIIIPWLLKAASRTGINVALNRLAPTIRRRNAHDGRSIVVYGQVLYKAPDHPLLGRWHLDRDNSFFINQAGMEGLVELARLSRIPIQQQARRSGGTAMTAMEIDLALQRGILVPFIKDQTEPFRSAAELLKADKGGLTYFPSPGLWENVVELDFAQQYPSLMDVWNISPETVNCDCCPDPLPVPGVNHHICRRRRGLVPDALAGLLGQRRRYKAIIKECSPEDRPKYDARQSALKWTLVTCFGYQGFKSAVFGIIPAHEAITAWGRETLLIAKEVYEDAGYRLLHALTDSLYVTKPGFAMEEVQRLAQEVKRRTGLTLAVEGVFDWISFSPSKARRDITAATRYFGRFSNGTLKLRGLKIRQHSTPPFIGRAQEAFLRIMGDCRGRDELVAVLSRLRATYQEFVRTLWSGKVPLNDLLIVARVSREPKDFRANSAVPLCLKLLAAEGIHIPPGQSLQYLIAHQRHREPRQRYLPVPLLDRARDYDARAYQVLLRDAFEEVVVNIPGADRINGWHRNLSLW